MSRARLDIGGGPSKSAVDQPASKSKAAGAGNPNKVKLIVAVVVLAAACAMIAYEVMPSSAPRPVVNPNTVQESTDAGTDTSVQIPVEPPRPKGSGKAGVAR